MVRKHTDVAKVPISANFLYFHRFWLLDDPNDLSSDEDCALVVTILGANSAGVWDVRCTDRPRPAICKRKLFTSMEANTYGKVKSLKDG